MVNIQLFEHLSLLTLLQLNMRQPGPLMLHSSPHSTTCSTPESQAQYSEHAEEILKENEKFGNSCFAIGSLNCVKFLIFVKFLDISCIKQQFFFIYIRSVLLQNIKLCLQDSLGEGVQSGGGDLRPPEQLLLHGVYNSSHQTNQGGSLEDCTISRREMKH